MILEELVSILGLRVDDRGLPAFRSSLAGTLAKVGLVSAGVFALAGAIGQLFDIASDTADGARAARNLGLPLDSLQRLEFAAKQTGLSVGSLRGAIAGLASGARQAATVGNDAFVVALDNLGVSMTESNGKLKTGRQLLLDIADAVQRASDQDFALVNAESLGLGPEFISFLRLGSGGIEALGAQVETTSERAVEASLRFERAMDRLRRTMNDFIIEGGTPALEGLASFGDRLLEASRSPGFAAFKSELGALGESLKTTAGDVGEFWKAIYETIPEGSRTDVLKLLGLGILARSHPYIAGAIAVGAVGQQIYEDRDIPAPAEVQALGQWFTDAAEKLGGILDYIPGSGYQPPAADFLPRGSTPGDRAAQQQAAREITQNITIEVNSPEEAADAVEALTSGSIEDGLGDRRTRVVK